MNEKELNSVEESVMTPELKEYLKKLVLERVSVMPSTLRMAVGSLELTREDLTRHVEEGDEIGQQIIEMNLDFLRDIASGAIYAG